jgi:hypothetical protein
MSSTWEATALIEQAIARLTAEQAAREQELQLEADLALEDWLLVEACKDYDMIDLEPAITGKSHRKYFKALRDRKRNTEKMIVALQALLEIARTPGGEKLLKKFADEQEKYQI